MQPELSVILPVHEEHCFLTKAINSVLAQDNIHLELLVICNGPNSDALQKWMTREYENDKRVRVFSLAVGQLSFALNFGICHARSNWVGRMDSDDVCATNRFRNQLDYAYANELDVCGSAVKLIDSHDKIIGSRDYPISHADIVEKLYWTNPFCHPSIVVKKQVLIDAKGYLGGFVSEDYDLWLRLDRRYVKFGNTAEYLLRYRCHPAASQGSKRAYAEVASHFFREMLLTKSFAMGKGWIGALIKFLVKGAKK